MNIREACEYVLGAELAAAIEIDHGLHWCAFVAMAACKKSHGPEAKWAISSYFEELKRKGNGA